MVSNLQPTMPESLESAQASGNHFSQKKQTRLTGWTESGASLNSHFDGLGRGCKHSRKAIAGDNRDWEDGMAKTVLIVEDNELNMKLFRDLLEAHGYQTSGTSNGHEALDLVRKMRPDLILMDIQLPQVSGLEVTRWIKDDPELRAIPVVAVTAFAMKGDEERIREGGCEAYLSKPISVGKFIETVRRFIG
jgi:two-component system cell cycle response regulator DivK